ncbi:MAG: sulfite exporter TauE/SafE family protein [Pseudomonadota bacterium]
MTVDPLLITIIVITFVLAGGVKGVIGLGLPTVTLALLTVALDLKTAMALLLVPSFVTNLWQALNGPHLFELLRRTWPFLLCATGAILPAATLLSRIDAAWLSAFLGLLLISYAVLSLGGLRIRLPERMTTPTGVIAGIVNGICTGLTGSFVVPGVLYLQSIGLSRDALIQAMGVLFTLSTLSLGIALRDNQLLSREQLIWSSGAVIPSLLGMWIGLRIRRRLSEARFRTVFFTAVLILGCYIVVAAVAKAI